MVPGASTEATVVPLFVWLGSSCCISREEVVAKLLPQLASVCPRAGTLPASNAVVETEDEESEEFWEAFEEGYDA